MSVLVGRERELGEIAALAEPSGSLVTLVGPGGVGKTRLARELGAWGWCDVASARTRQDVAVAWAAAFGPGTAVLGPVLVVIDGVEWLAAEALAELDRRVAAAEVRAVLTSRRPTGIAREQLYPVRPLGIEPAVALFVACARRRDPSWTPTEDDLEAVGRLAAHLDRLPLALELAAARRAVMSPRELVDHLPDRFRLLRPVPGSPVRALWEVIADSWAALDDAARAVLVGVTAFRGGFTLAAARTVLDGDEFHLKGAPPPGPPEFLPDVLQALCDGNLVVATADPVTGTTRFEPYESVREFAAPFAGDEDALAERHARWVEAMLADAEERFRTGPVGVLRHALAAERWNVVAAFERLLPRDPARALAVAVSGSRIAALDAPEPWLERIEAAAARVPDPSPELIVSAAAARAGLLFDAGRSRAAAETAAEALAAASDRPTHRARLDRVLGQALWRLGDTVGAGRASRDAHAAAVAGGAGCEEALALLALEMTHRDAGDLEGGRRCLEAALERARGLRDPWIEGSVLVSMSPHHEDLDRRRARNHEALALGSATGLMVRAVARGNLAKLDLEAGHPAGAIAHAEAGLALASAWPYTRRWLLGLLAGGLVDEGRLDEADAALVAAGRLRVEADRRSGAGLAAERAEWHVARGDLAAALPLLATVEASGPFPAVTLRRAQVLAVLGERGAEEALAAAAASDLASPGWDVLVAATRALVRGEPELPARSLPPPAPGEPDLRRRMRHLHAAWERSRPPVHTLEVAAEAAAYTLDGVRVDLARRGPQRRILARLAEVHARAPGAASDVYDLFEAGWPDERAPHGVVTSRVYTAVQRLRDSGLRAVLLQTEEGYALDPALVVRRP